VTVPERGAGFGIGLKIGESGGRVGRVDKPRKKGIPKYHKCTDSMNLQVRPYEVIERPHSNAGRILRLCLIASLLLSGLIVFLVFSPSDSSTESILTSNHKPSKLFEETYGSYRLESESSDIVQINAVDLLSKFKYWSEQAQSDLPDACGASKFPCVDKIGSCVFASLVKSENGKITPRTDACACFATAFRAADTSGDPTLLATTNEPCSFHCISAILKIAEQYVSTSNGRDGPFLQCSSIMNTLAVDTYGNRNSMVSDDGNTDAFSLIPMDNPAVLSAAEAFRLHLLKFRLENCPDHANSADPATVVYSKSGLITNGRSEYRMEVAIGDEVFIVRIAHLPKNEELVDPMENRLFNDSSNLLGRFRVMSTTPQPCSVDFADKLAVSASGMACPFFFKLSSWSLEGHLPCVYQQGWRQSTARTFLGERCSRRSSKGGR
jgi:hypothetical protein